MKYTAAHWGSYSFQTGDADLTPISDDAAPSRIGEGWVSASQNKNARVLAPVARKGWLAGDKGANRCNDSFVEITWDRATELVADELTRVRQEHSNEAIFGGSYGWSSSGRFHHAQGQMRRLLAVCGGYTSSRETYSHAAAEVLFPHIIGMSNGAFQDQMTSLSLVAKHCEFVLAFGGISARTAQVASAGTGPHDVGTWLEKMERAGVRVLSISPERGEATEWLSIRPGTDTALILALVHEIVSQGAEDVTFLDRYTSGWNNLKAYVLGEADGTAKSADWASPICDIPAATIRNIATELMRRKSMISMTWSMQRADHGEQPIWAGLALACVLGQIGQPGTGYAFGYGCTTQVGRPCKLISWPSLPKIKNNVSDYIPVARIADALLHPHEPYQYNGTHRTFPNLKLVWWSGGNPFHHHQDLRRLERAWSRPETVIVSEQSWTASARRADIVLPATTALERNDLMLNSRSPTLMFMSKFHDPVGLARNDFDFSADIADRLGQRDAYTAGLDTDGWLRKMWSDAIAIAVQHDIALPDFEQFCTMGRFDIPDAFEERIAFADFIKDPEGSPLGSESGKFTLFNERIAAMGYENCPGHPSWLPPVEGATLSHNEFHLISGQPDTRLHSQNDMGNASQDAKLNGREVAKLHPDAAHRLNVKGGDLLRIFNERGACLAAVQLSDGIREDCVSLPTGAWFDPQQVAGEVIEVHGNPNVLTIDKGCSKLSQGNIAHTCVVRVEKWTTPLPPLSVTLQPKIERAT